MHCGRARKPILLHMGSSPKPHWCATRTQKIRKLRHFPSFQRGKLSKLWSSDRATNWRRKGASACSFAKLMTGGLGCRMVLQGSKAMRHAQVVFSDFIVNLCANKHKHAPKEVEQQLRWYEQFPLLKLKLLLLRLNVLAPLPQINSLLLCSDCSELRTLNLCWTQQPRAPHSRKTYSSSAFERKKLGNIAKPSRIYI